VAASRAVLGTFLVPHRDADDATSYRIPNVAVRPRGVNRSASRGSSNVLTACPRTVDDGVHAVFRANERDARAEPVAAALGACPVALVAGDSDLQAVRAVELVVLTPPSPEIGPRSVHFTGAAAALQPLRRGETRPSWKIAALYFIGAAISLAILVFVIG
jgi:hypothetical protein